nr:DNA primase family protein [Aliihoeflea sp. 40Bstr573]
MPDQVGAILAEAERQAALLGPATPSGQDRTVADDADEGEAGISHRDGERVDMDTVARCAALDHSDTDNAERLLAHFGEDLLVLAQSKARKAAFAVWAGDHWDIDTGDPRALAIAQKLGGRIALEAGVLKMTKEDQELVDRAKAAEAKASNDLTQVERLVIAKAEKAVEAYRKRVQRRHSHAVSSKNKGRLEAMLACAAPHVMRGPDEFNADALKVAVKGHTLAFRVKEKRVPNPVWGADGDDPTIDRSKIAQFVMQKDVQLLVRKGHAREDLITQIVPVDYDAKATCPRWLDFMDDKLPLADVRRMVQVASGLGLVGLTVQKLFFHYGFGANGKSVYMETLCRLLGEIAVTLPSESFTGEGKGGGAANPDMARLYGRRLLRVKEMPEGEDLRENLVKDLTGGEDFTVRDLFQGYFDFKPIFVGHMSGNAYPRISGTDNGIWRRMAVVHWPKTIAEADQLPFEEVLAQFAPEYPGILNWLIDGVKIFLSEGLVIPESVKAKTQEYRDEMDPTSAFCARCIVAEATAPPVSAKDFYQAYVDFTIDQGGKPISLTRFGLIMKKKFTREDGRIVLYHGIRLQEVPRPPANHGADDYESHVR